MTVPGRLALVGSVVAFVAACESRPRSERLTSEPDCPPGKPRELSLQQALNSARAFMARSSAAPRCLVSTAIEAVDSPWCVTFRRRTQFVIPDVVTVDVNALMGSMRFPGDE